MWGEIARRRRENFEVVTSFCEISFEIWPQKSVQPTKYFRPPAFGRVKFLAAGLRPGKIFTRRPPAG